jgi:hypothetical protein
LSEFGEIKAAQPKILVTLGDFLAQLVIDCIMVQSEEFHQFGCIFCPGVISNRGITGVAKMVDAGIKE